MERFNRSRFVTGGVASKRRAAPPGARRRQVTRTFDTIREARDFVSETRTALVRGNFTAPSKLTVRALAEAWLADRQAESESPGGIREVSVNGYRSALHAVLLVGSAIGLKSCQQVNGDGDRLLVRSARKLADAPAALLSLRRNLVGIIHQGVNKERLPPLRQFSPNKFKKIVLSFLKCYDILPPWRKLRENRDIQIPIHGKGKRPRDRGCGHNQSMRLRPLLP